MSYTIETWCKEHDVSRSTFYKLRKEGRAPRLFEVTPGCPRISARQTKNGSGPARPSNPRRPDHDAQTQIQTHITQKAFHP